MNMNEHRGVARGGIVRDGLQIHGAVPTGVPMRLEGGAVYVAARSLKPDAVIVPAGLLRPRRVASIERWILAGLVRLNLDDGSTLQLREGERVRLALDARPTPHRLT